MVERTQPAWAATDTLTAGAARHAAGLSATGWSEAASGQSVSSFENVLESHLPAQGKAAAAWAGQPFIFGAGCVLEGWIARDIFGRSIVSSGKGERHVCAG
jgi:hypothetical protein